MKERKTNLSVSFSLKMIIEIDDWVEKHGGTFSTFVREACNYYLDHNPNVSTVSINDSEPPDIIDDVVKEALKDIPKDTEPPPNDDTPKKNDFNFDDI